MIYATETTSGVRIHMCGEETGVDPDALIEMTFSQFYDFNIKRLAKTHNIKVFEEAFGLAINADDELSSAGLLVDLSVGLHLVERSLESLYNLRDNK